MLWQGFKPVSGFMNIMAFRLLRLLQYELQKGTCMYGDRLDMVHVCMVFCKWEYF